jgi:hypothetical protein
VGLCVVVGGLVGEGDGGVKSRGVADGNPIAVCKNLGIYR